MVGVDERRALEDPDRTRDERGAEEAGGDAALTEGGQERVSEISEGANDERRDCGDV